MKDEEIQQMAEFEDRYWWFVGRRKIISSILEKRIDIKPDLKILDVGCGTGGTTIHLTKFGVVYGTDFSLSALKYSNRRGLDKVFMSSVFNLPFKAETFDVITILDSLEHIKDDLEVLKELKRVIKKDGIIVIAVPAFQFLWSEHDVALSHFRRYNSKSLLKIVQMAGLKSTWFSYMVFFLFPFIAIYRMTRKRRKNKLTPKTDLGKLPSFMNDMFEKLLYLESRIIQYVRFPFGLSLICIAKADSTDPFS